MKALAAVSIRQYERAVEALAEYNRTVEMGLKALLKHKPFGATLAEPVQGERLGAVLFGSDQGMVGQFNEIIASHAMDELNKLEPKKDRRSVCAVGLRAMSRLEELGQPVEDFLSLPGSVSAITPAVQDLFLRMEEWRTKREIGRIVLFNNRPTAGASYAPQTVHLLPVDPDWFHGVDEGPWPSRSLPSFTMDWGRLLSSLIRQLLFVSLFRAFADSLAGENASRLASMQVAEKNIGERLAHLMTQFHQRRQSSITDELLDIVSGFEALSSRRI
jgi:F-type H+-transporting ATPase subunit gamma